MKPDFRRAPALLAVAVALLAVQNRSPLAAADIPADKAAVEHALNRLTFGPRPGQIEEVQRLGLARWMDQQLNPSSIDDSVLLTKLTPLPDAPAIAGRRTARNMSETERMELQRQARQFGRQP